MELREGVCPECGELLVYRRGPTMDDAADGEIYWEVECVDCGYLGREYHKLEFVGYESVREVE